MVSIKEYVSKELIFIQNEIPSKEKAIDFLCSRIAAIKNREASGLIEAVRDRESKISTGIGLGIAVPHGRLPRWGETTLSILLLRKPVEYDALDGKPVRLILLFISDKDKPCEHINLLSRISYILSEKDNLQALLKSETPDELYKSFVEYSARV
ncbi:MAG TPA: PTS sugar transporter subunit IIA [Candidatus Mcinerneyibacteriales bacterium]|nr:PTS sugar transporter subunit IIA [Candidatus Mcinerneyibacteriales bacterium]